MASSQRKGENDSNEQQVGEVEGDTEKVPLHSDNDDNQEEPPPAYNPNTTITIDNKNNTGNMVSSYAGTTTNTGVNEPLRRDNNAAPPSGVVTIPMDNLEKNANTNTNTNNTMYAGTEYKAGYNKVSQQAPAPVSTTAPAAAQATTTKTKTTHGGYEHAPHPPRGHYDNDEHRHNNNNNNNNNQDARYDDPTCLYVLAVFSIFIPLVGWIGMCAYQCGNGLGPRQTEAFKRLCLCTVIGVIIDIIYYSSD